MENARPAFRDAVSKTAPAHPGRGWFELEPGAPGDYAAICFIPGRDGIPHVMAGMLVEFTVDA